MKEIRELKDLTIHDVQPVSNEFHVETLKLYKLGFNQTYYTFDLILLMKIVLRSKFH